jgi:capsular exopolysaccharide synthesis family protein
MINKKLVTLTSPGSFAAEQYQGLRLKLEGRRQAGTCQVIAVTSAGAGDGKTLTSINLAGALSKDHEARVLLIDADLRRSSVAPQLGIGPAESAGLSELIAKPQTKLADVTVRPDALSFATIPAGETPDSVHHLFRSPRLAALLAEARQQYDYVLLDTPPLVPVFDAALLSRLVDGVIVVVSANKTPRRLLEAALDVLDPGKVIGIVFNGDTNPMFGYSRSYYHPYFPAQSASA